MAEQGALIRVLQTGMFPIDSIDMGKHQVRTRHVEDNLDPLKNSMARFGQLASITIYEKNGRYELLAGQRRLSAAEQLGWDKIRADLIARPRDDLVAKAISLIDNEMRQSVSHADVVKACTEFFYRLGSAKAVAAELALPYALVRNAVKLPRCPIEVQAAVKDGHIQLHTAIRATDALRWEDGRTEGGDKVLDLAKRMEDKMPRDLQKAIMSVGRSDPGKPLEQIIEEAKYRRKPDPIKVVLSHEDVGRLSKFAKDEELDEDEAASSLVLDGLESRGY